MDTVVLLDRCVQTLKDMKAEDIKIIDLREKTVIADYFVVATANSDRQASAMVNELVDNTEKVKRRLVRKSSMKESGWMVLDISYVMVHIFLHNMRQKYNLESLWTVEYDKVLQEEKEKYRGFH